MQFAGDITVALCCTKKIQQRLLASLVKIQLLDSACIHHGTGDHQSRCPVTTEPLSDDGPVQLASKIGRCLRAVPGCHLMQTSTDSTQLTTDITSLIDVNKNASVDDKLLRQSDCYGVLLFCSCTTYVIKQY